MFNGTTESISKIEDGPEMTMRQRNRALSIVAANLVTCLAKSTIGNQLSIENKTFVTFSDMNSCRPSHLVKKSDVVWFVQSNTIQERPSR